ncbi:MAG: hypothetical protein IPL35_03530 [Sphingobacteriales bacterium]|nr:hypothetical protein [Sphingobacteriales bacterium]
MKHYFITCCAALLLMASHVNAQNACELYYPILEHSAYKYAIYDDKGKSDGSYQYQVETYKVVGNGFEATMGIKMNDEKNKEMMQGTYGLMCKDEKMYIDMSRMMPANMSEQFPDAKMVFDNQYLDFPSNPKVGDHLNDFSTTMEMQTNGNTMMTMKIYITDRTVEREENLTTAAGTFTCLVFSENSKSETYMGNLKLMTINSSSKMWYAKDMGMVKTESYDKKGKLESRVELVEFKR